MSDDNKDWLGKLFRGLLWTVGIILLIIAVSFGLLVGFCGLMSLR